jgi:hypothetical protein
MDHAYLLYYKIILSDLYHISSRLFRVTASTVALTDISFCCESGSPCFSSVHCSQCYGFTDINHASNLLPCRLSHCVFLSLEVHAKRGILHAANTGRNDAIKLPSNCFLSWNQQVCRVTMRQSMCHVIHNAR